MILRVSGAEGTDANGVSRAVLPDSVHADSKH
jgi:hypothetical protein